MIKSLLKGLIISVSGIFMIVLLAAWGNTGHSIISRNSAALMPEPLKKLVNWEVELALHASDADNRKSNDPTESPKHFIDLDNYSEFMSGGKIEQNYDQIVAKYTEKTVLRNGTLPWATINTYKMLVQSFKNKDWAKVVFYASDLGHYVADGHMPLHITANYDGQKTGQTGIHSRYESSMIGKYSSQLVYQNRPVAEIQNPEQYIFDYIYNNFQYVNAVLNADTKATQSAGGSTSSSDYYSALWLETKDFTISMFRNGSSALADLIYTAWIAAGRPDLTTAFNDIENDYAQCKIYPNPAAEYVVVNIAEKNIGKPVTVRIYDATGKAVLSESFSTITKDGVRLNVSKLPEMMYLAETECSGNKSINKLLIKR